MTPERALQFRLSAAWCLAACLLAGCSWIPRKVPLDAAAGLYDSASLSYRIDAGKLQQPLDVVRVEGPNVIYEQVASSPLADESIGTLTLVYPHPGGRSGYAQAKFVLASGAAKSGSPPAKSSWNWWSKKKPDSPASPPTAPSGSQPEIYETWVLDVPSADSDLIFKALSSQNFFNTERPAAVGVELAVKMNGQEVRKSWDQVIELNALAQRVRRQGQLVAYARPSTAAGQPTSAISSTRVYGDLMAQGGARSVAGSVPAPASAFSLTTPTPPGGTPPAAVASRPAALR